MCTIASELIFDGDGEVHLFADEELRAKQGLAAKTSGMEASCD